MQVPLADEGAAFPNMMWIPLDWIRRRQTAQRAPSLRSFFSAYLQCDPPSHLYHAQGAQFSLSRRAIHRHPRSLYRSLLDQLRHTDPVASYYLELMWWYIFHEHAGC